MTDPVIEMATFEFLTVAHMRLTAVQCDARDALLGSRGIVASLRSATRRS